MFPVKRPQKVGQRREEGGQAGDGIRQGAFQYAVAQWRVEPADEAQQRRLCRGEHGIEPAGQICFYRVEETNQAAALGRLLARSSREGSSRLAGGQEDGVIVARLEVTEDKGQPVCAREPRGRF